MWASFLLLIITSFEAQQLCCVLGVMELLQGLIRRRGLFSSCTHLSSCCCLFEGDRLIWEA